MNRPTIDLVAVKGALNEFAFSSEGVSAAQLQADFADLVLQIFRLAERLGLDLVRATEELRQPEDLHVPLLALVPYRPGTHRGSEP